jgi:hypothetical protein
MAKKQICKTLGDLIERGTKEESAHWALKFFPVGVLITMDQILNDIDSPKKFREYIPDDGKYQVGDTILLGEKILEFGSEIDNEIPRILGLLRCVKRSMGRIDDRISDYSSKKRAIQYLRDYCIQVEQITLEWTTRKKIPIDRGGRRECNGGRMSGDYVKQKLVAYGESIKGKSEKELAKIKLEQILKATGLSKTTVAVSPLWKRIAALKKKYKRASVGAMSKGIEESYGEKGDGEIGYCGNRRKAKPADPSEDEDK